MVIDCQGEKYTEIFKLSSKDSIASNCYILKSGNEMCVIDPSHHSDAARARVGFSDLDFRYVILSHTHYDHIIHINSYIGASTEILVCARDAAGLSDPALNLSPWLCGKEFAYEGKYRLVSDGQIITLGNEQLRVIETPGHTRGSICLIGEGFIFTGDTVFANGGYGRFDLPGGDPLALQKSLHRIANLNKELIIYSGHGEDSTVSEAAAYFKQRT